MPLTDHTDCVLVVIDVQPGFGGDADVLARMHWLTKLARALDVPVVVTEEEPERHGPTRPGFVEDGTPVFRKPTFGLAGTPEILQAVHATRAAAPPCSSASRPTCASTSRRSACSTPACA